ncbi:hypothetical protein Q9L58_006935 [Maublancomyces gigas]|uniref:Tyrosinase copper-binding domain-containing protein n=1 Tax=Discina gigas TaxID=1032678 RepID=A0ABR3GE49_9PEZI
MITLQRVTAISLFLLPAFLSLPSRTATAPLPPLDLFSNSTCTAPPQRKEWRTLPPHEKQAYLAAVLCLQRRASTLRPTLPGAVSRFDDFQGVHIQHMETVHLNGQFLPWHRYFTAVYEDALRVQCGFGGAQPYWDWTLDADGVWAESPVFSPIDGFGGNGPYVPCEDQPFEAFCIPNGTGGGCVPDGPFRNLTLHLGPGQNVHRNDHCLRRNFHLQSIQYWFSASEVAQTLEEDSYVRFWRRLEGLFEVHRIGLHGAGHLGVGGTLSDVYSSPGDPLFYLHHANLDRLWWQWQQLNPTERLTDISGPDSQGPTARNVTLQYEIDLGKLALKVKIADVMHIGRRALCYGYA